MYGVACGLTAKSVANLLPISTDTTKRWTDIYDVTGTCDFSSCNLEEKSGTTWGATATGAPTIGTTGLVSTGTGEGTVSSRIFRTTCNAVISNEIIINYSCTTSNTVKSSSPLVYTVIAGTTGYVKIPNTYSA